MTIEEQFKAAVISSKNLTERPTNEILLKLYGLYKQGEVGNVIGDRPGGFDFKGAAKYDAWENEKDRPSEEAMKEYVTIIDGLIEKES
jgi:diazepam-binding inhibitor (GABA receptor modulating acyl-CoA-binding protein)